MKKLLTLTAAGAIFTAPAMAVQKCVAFDASTTTCLLNSPDSKIDWSSTCTTNGTSVTIKGVGICSTQRNDTEFGTSDTITIGDNRNLGVNCWCKMVEPAVSSWVFLFDWSSYNDCLDDCSYFCGYNTMLYPKYLSALFGSISN